MPKDYGVIITVRIPEWLLIEWDKTNPYTKPNGKKNRSAYMKNMALLAVQDRIDPELFESEMRRVDNESEE
jgi:hypothetical protein